MAQSTAGHNNIFAQSGELIAFSITQFGTEITVEKAAGRTNRLKLLEALFQHLCEDDIVRPTFVTGHPTEISPLSRTDRTDPWLTERFELFVDSRELANGYSELNDPAEQRQRFEDEQAAKDAGVYGDEPVTEEQPVDETGERPSA